MANFKEIVRKLNISFLSGEGLDEHAFMLVSKKFES